MGKKLFLIFAMLIAVSFLPQGYAQQKELTQEQIVEIATLAVKEKGLKLDEVNIIYDQDNKLWCQTLGEGTILDTSPNHGILKKGFLKNYRTVFFDFKEPIKDIWVFVDKDTGEVLEVFQEP